MNSRHVKMRMINEEDDRLSSLPNELIHKILSFINMTEAIETSVLSSRWRFVWTSMPHLNFSSEGFSTLPKFSKFIKHVMSRLKARNNLTKVHSVKLCFRGKAGQPFVERVLNYVLSHNIQELNVVCFLKNHIELPLSLFSSRSLKHLSVETQRIDRFNRIHDIGYLASTLELPALTTLRLHYFTFCDDNAGTSIGVFSKCPNLENLFLKRFATKGSNSFSISHPRLSNLTLEHDCHRVTVVNVAAPQLKNLTIRSCYSKFVISAPVLASLFYKGSFPWKLSIEGFLSLEKAHICFQSLQRDDNVQDVVSLLQQLQSVKFLTLNLEIVELLSSSAGLLLPQPSPFVNLKILSIYPESLYYYLGYPSTKVAMSTKLKSFLLDGCPGATLTMILREEVQAQKRMDELRVLLAKEKDDTKISRAHLEQAAIPESKTQKLNTGGSTSQTESCWKKLDVQIEKARPLISKLQGIEELLIKLPASHRAKVQTRFSSIFAEARVTISKIIDRMKIQCDENGSRSTVILS